jgi:hypothetical protein
MRRRLAPHVRRLAAALALVAALGTTGCVPGAAWLPDSSGILYTTGKEFTRLIHYDLAKKEQRVLVADTGAPTLWPAVSPDGKHVAVARLHVKENKGPATIQVIVYGLDGKEVRRSKVFPWADKTKPGSPSDQWPGLPAQLFWGPKDKGILLSDGANNAGIYDPTEDRLINLKDRWLLTFAGGPVRPDGAGFLVMVNASGFPNPPPNEKLGPPGFRFVDWQGKEKEIKPPALFFDKQALSKEKDLNKLLGLLLPVAYQSGWERDVASVSWNGDRLRYLTGKGEAVLDKIKPLLAADGRLVQMRYTFPNGTEVRVVSPATPEKLDAGPETGRVEVLKAGGGRAEVVLREARICVPNVSPSGRMIALWCVSGPEQREKQLRDILIIDDKGGVPARLRVPH